MHSNILASSDPRFNHHSRTTSLPSREFEPHYSHVFPNVGPGSVGFPTSSSLFCLIDAMSSALLFQEVPGLSGACPPPPAPCWNIGNDKGFCLCDDGVDLPPVKATEGAAAEVGVAAGAAGGGCGCILIFVDFPVAESGFKGCSSVGFVPARGRESGCCT